MRAAELAAGLALAVVAARASSAWELVALAWLALLAVPLAFIDMAVRQLPDPLIAAAFAGTFALLAIGAVACRLLPGPGVIRPGGLGLGDAKLAASAGAALGWIQLAGAAVQHPRRVRPGWDVAAHCWPCTRPPTPGGRRVRRLANADLQAVALATRIERLYVPTHTHCAA